MCNPLLCRNQSQSTVFYQSGRNHACSMHPEHNLALQRAPIDHVPRARMPIESGLSPIRVRIERNTSMIRAQCHDVSPVGITATFTGPRRKSLFPKAARPAAPCATYCYPTLFAIGLRFCQSVQRCVAASDIGSLSVTEQRKSSRFCSSMSAR